MQYRFTSGSLAIAMMIAARAWAFAPDNSDVAQVMSVRPPRAAALQHKSATMTLAPGEASDGSVTFLGIAPLPQTWLAAGGGDALLTYFQQQASGAQIELLQVSRIETADELRAAYVQTWRGVPIEGTFAIAQVQLGHLHYARHFFVDPPHVDTTPRVTADLAAAAAVVDAEGFVQQAHVEGAPALTIVYVRGVGTLAWRVDVSSDQGRWDEYVDAQGAGVLLRHKTSMDAIAGEVEAQFEPSCEGDTPVTTSVPYVQWTPGWATNSNGQFSATSNVRQTHVQLNGAFVRVDSYDNNNLEWVAPLQPAPAFNTITLDQMPLSQIDPYMYINQVRDWVRARAATIPALNRSRIWSWTNSQLRVKANLPNGYQTYSCNAFYDGTALNFYVDYPKWGCNNSGRSNKIVYHEYGHGIHDHLRTDPTFDHQVSEGVADFTMASFTGDPNVTGLMGCNEILPGRSTMRTCVNQYTYCDNSSCNSYPGDEPHNSAPILCGALWEVRNALIGQYGETTGALRSDQFFLRFLTLVQDMDSSYAAAIAADDDIDGDPRNGTDHSCAINQAFLGDGAGGFAHFPGLAGQRVPCVPKL